MRSWVAAVLDVAAIGTFAAVGRANHAESGGLAGLAETAWPFVAGWAAGALLIRFWRRPKAVATGVGLVASTVAGGMLLRALTGGGVQPSFVVVATIALAVLLLGWRAAYGLATRRRTQIA